MSLRLILSLSLALAACGPAVAEPPPPEPPAERPDAGPVTQNTPADSGTGASGDLPCDVAQVLVRTCLECHRPTPMNGAPDSLATRADLLKESFRGGTQGQRSVDRMKDTQVPMPPAYLGKRVTAAEIAVMENWVNAGMPAGLCAASSANTTP